MAGKDNFGELRTHFEAGSTTPPATKRPDKAARRAEQAAANKASEEGGLLGALEAKFWAAPFGQARAAKVSGDKYFQIEIPLNMTVHAVKLTATIATASREYSGIGRTIGDIEAEGWELINSGFVFQETGQVSRDKFLSSGQQVNTTGVTVGVYLFRANEKPARTDEVWKAWAEEGHS